MEDLRNSPYFNEILEAFESRFVPDPNSGCFHWTGSVFSKGYGSFTMRPHGFMQARAHRMSWQIYKGPIPEGIHVLHKCDVRSCVNIDHLFLGTNADNVADMVAKCRQAKGPTHARLNGENHGMSKITDLQAIKILYDPRLQKNIAEDFNISQTTVSDIKRGKVRKRIYLEKSL